MLKNESKQFFAKICAQINLQNFKFENWWPGFIDGVNVKILIFWKTFNPIWKVNFARKSPEKRANSWIKFRTPVFVKTHTF